jgi:hypothetical protein
MNVALLDGRPGDRRDADAGAERRRSHEADGRWAEEAEQAGFDGALAIPAGPDRARHPLRNPTNRGAPS